MKSFKQGKTQLRGAVATAVRNANNPDAAAAGAGAGAGVRGDGGGGGAKASGKDTSSKAAAAAEAAPTGPMTRSTRHGGRRRRDDETTPAPKRQRQAKFIPVAKDIDVTLNTSGDGDSARDTYKCVSACPPVRHINCNEVVFATLSLTHSLPPSLIISITHPPSCLVATCRGRCKWYAANWGGLADGVSAEGVPLGGNGKPILRCVQGHVSSLHPDTYLKSLSRWVVVTGTTSKDGV